MKEKITLLTGLIWVLAWFGFMLFYTFLDVAIWRKFFPAGRKYLNLVSIALSTAGYLFLLVKKNRFHIRPFENISLAGILLSAGCAVFFYFALDHFIDLALAKLFPSSDAKYQEALIELSKSPVISWIQICILAPILEETLMRGFLLGGLTAGYGKGVALLVSALLFALLHLNTVQTLSAFVCGIVLGLVYLHTGSLICCILAHSGYNLLAYLTTILPLCTKQ